MSHAITQRLRKVEADLEWVRDKLREDYYKRLPMRVCDYRGNALGTLHSVGVALTETRKRIEADTTT